MMSKASKVMLGTTLVLLLILMLISAPAFAQVLIDQNECKDKCEDSVLYLKGVWDEKLRQCVYAVEEPCKYGCEFVSCKDFPDIPPVNETELDENVWEMLKRLYDKDRASGSIQVFGTEYEINDDGTIFVQLKDNQGIPVNDGSCQIDIYYPNQPNSTHAVLLKNAPLIYLNGSDAIYYYDINIPNVTGIYMVSASCSYSFQNFWIYPTNSIYYPNVTRLFGSYSGSTIVLNSPTDYLYTFCSSTGGGIKECTSEYEWNISYYGVNQTAINAIGVHYLGETSTSGVHLTMYVWNWSDYSWYNLPNNITFSGLAKSGYPTGINNYLGNTIMDDGEDPQDFINTSGIIKVKLQSTLGTNFDQYNNWLALSVMAQEGVVVDVKGSSELHVSNHMENITMLISNLSNLTAEQVWNYPARNLTYINYTEVIDRIDALDIQLSGNFSQILGYLQSINATVHLNNQTLYQIWGFQLNELSSNLTEIQLYLADINATAHGNYEWLIGLANVSVYDIWNYSDRELTTEHAQITVSGTEYQSGEIGTVWIVLTKILGTGSHAPINNATCETYIRYPNSSMFLDNQSMTYIPSSFGVYHYNFTVPDVTGNYGVGVYCKDGTKDYLEIGSFHVAPWANIIKDFNFTEVLTAISNTNQTLYDAIFDSNTSIIARLDAHNGTIMAKLYGMQTEISDLNDTLLEAIINSNSSIISQIELVNQTLYNAIADSNSSIIVRMDAHNSTIMTKLYSLQSDIANLNDLSASEVWSYSTRTLTDYNQSEIIGLLNNINLTMYNLTIGNISVSAYVNWTEGVVQMNNISNPTVVEAQVLSFAGANQDDIITTTYQYCIDNMTLGYDINTTRCWLNQCYTINETRPLPCDYGCYNHQCNPEPFDRTLFLIGIFALIFAGLVAIALLYDRFQK